MSDKALREQICQIGRLMYQNGYIDSTSGNISARLGPDRILCTPSGLAKGFMSPDQLIEVDPDGNRVGAVTEANAHLKPTSEILMHLECYRQRDDVNGVVHAHPPTAIALTIAGIGLEDCAVPEAIIILGIIPTTPYATPSSAENRDAIRSLIREHDGLMLAYHGSLTVADSVWNAYMRLETLEHTAKIMYMAHQLGNVIPLPPHQIDKLLAQRRQLGLMRPGDVQRFRHAYGLDDTNDLEARIRAIVREALADLQL
ncbi:MAG: class II aldolase/adducin family protein [Anaerolineae bacterium]|nr:class II aldolase/adducin family protein [Anaerolineae bacterium]